MEPDVTSLNCEAIVRDVLNYLSELNVPVYAAGSPANLKGVMSPVERMKLYAANRRAEIEQLRRDKQDVTDRLETVSKGLAGHMAKIDELEDKLKETEVDLFDSYRIEQRLQAALAVVGGELGRVTNELEELKNKESDD